MAVLLASGVLAEGDVQAPVLCVLDAPVLADHFGERFCLGRMAADVKPRFPGLALADLAITSHRRERAEVFPGHAPEMVGGDFDHVADALFAPSVPLLGGLMGFVGQAREIVVDAIVAELLHVAL